jgi:methyl-accepting chemotaxis protein
MPLINLRIRGRLFAGFGTLIVFGVTLAGFAVWQLGEIRAQVDGLARESTNTIRIGELTTELQGIRRSMLRYLFDQDETRFAESETRLAKVTDLLELAAKSAQSDERRTGYQDVAKDMVDLKAKRAALADAIKSMLSARELLFSEGDKMAADVQKFVEAADKMDFAPQARLLESNVLLVGVANWRMLATRNPNGVATFRTNFAKVQRQIAEFEKAGLPANLVSMLGTIKASTGKYSDAFEKASTNLMLGDERYYKSIVPVTVGATEKLSGLQDSIKKLFERTKADTEDRISSTMFLQEIVAGVAALAGLLIAFLIARGIVGPISGLSSSMLKLASGNLDVAVPGLDRKDEVGEMAHTVEVFKNNGLEMVRMRAEQDVTEKRSAEQRKADMMKLADQFESAVGQIVETVSSASNELEASATSLTSTAERSEQLTTSVAAASEQASTNVQSVASATEELSSSVSEISRQVQESARMATDAVGQARITNERVSELTKAASRIGDVVELINTIAGQTNLLALNATIEAARAGEAGRGFAVVASEVKALAEQTSKATGEIGQQIMGIQAATEESVNAIKEISSTIERLSEISSTIAAAVEEQGAATQEISRNVQQAAQGTQQVSANITDVQRGASETGTASSQVLSAAQSLSGDSGRLKLEVGKFLDTVRAA